MANKNKYSKEFKLDCVKRILSGKDTLEFLSKKFKINHSTLKNWIISYQLFHDAAFDQRTNNKSYSKELKEALIKDYLTGKYSRRDLQIKYKLTSASLVNNWIFNYNKGNDIIGYNPVPGVYKMKARKTTQEERIEIVKYVLSNNNDYKGAKIKYVVPYASIHNWIRKYKEFGEDGLADNRGRPSLSTKKQKKLTTEELQQIEIEKLEHELEYKNKVIEVLKKKNEIMEKLEQNSH